MIFVKKTGKKLSPKFTFKYISKKSVPAAGFSIDVALLHVIFIEKDWEIFDHCKVFTFLILHVQINNTYNLITTFKNVNLTISFMKDYHL